MFTWFLAALRRRRWEAQVSRNIARGVELRGW